MLVVVFVRAAVVLSPTGECRHRYTGPAEELLSRDLSSLCPEIHRVDDLIKGVVGDPVSTQGASVAFLAARAPAAAWQ
jgi:hypothetical protein